MTGRGPEGGGWEYALHAYPHHPRTVNGHLGRSGNLDGLR